MIPAIWGAVKALSIGQQAISAAVIVAMLGGLWGWGWLVGHRSGSDGKQQEWDASITRQAAESVKQVAALYESREGVIRRAEHDKRTLNDKITDLKRKQAIYEQSISGPCEAPPRSRDMFDATRGLLAADPERLSAADAAAGSLHEPPEARIEITRLLLAYVRAYGDAAEQLAGLWIDYDGLVQERRGQYIVEQARIADE